MPVYEYICHKCGLKFEFLLRNNADVISCPHCSSKDLKRLISAFAFSSKDARGNVTAGSAKNCSGCTSHNCSSC